MSETKTASSKLSVPEFFAYCILTGVIATTAFPAVESIIHGNPKFSVADSDTIYS